MNQIEQIYKHIQSIQEQMLSISKNISDLSTKMITLVATDAIQTSTNSGDTIPNS